MQMLISKYICSKIGQCKTQWKKERLNTGLNFYKNKVRHFQCFFITHGNTVLFEHLTEYNEKNEEIQELKKKVILDSNQHCITGYVGQVAIVLVHRTHYINTRNNIFVNIANIYQCGYHKAPLGHIECYCIQFCQGKCISVGVQLQKRKCVLEFCSGNGSVTPALLPVRRTHNNFNDACVVCGIC